MSTSPGALPAYLRLPDGTRLTGTIALDVDGQLLFAARRAPEPRPSPGEVMHLLIAGLPEGEDAQLSIPVSVAAVNGNALRLAPRQAVSPRLRRLLSAEDDAPDDAGLRLLQRMEERGLNELQLAIRRFLIDLGDHLFDLSTSSRYGGSGKHPHYDALNQLKRTNQQVIDHFLRAVTESLYKMEKDPGDGESADLETMQAGSLDLIALEEIDQQLAIQKVVNALVERFRVELEALTIRAAQLCRLEPRRARTPFHPAYLTKALVASLGSVTQSTVVIEDMLRFFRQRFGNELDRIYAQLNRQLAEADIEPDIEARIREHGSLLTPAGPDKRHLSRSERERDHSSSSQTDDVGTLGLPDSVASEKPEEPAGDMALRGLGAADPSRTPEALSIDEKARHDTIYAAVLAALSTHGGGLSHAQESVQDAAVAGPARRGTPVQSSPDTGAAGADSTVQTPAILERLAMLDASAPAVASLSELPPLEGQLQDLAADGEGALAPDCANRLRFVDNIFSTLHNNFDVSAEMAPNLARLRTPLARLSLLEPQFFTEPAHPAHGVLDTLSQLASADHTMSRSLRSKVASIIERVANDYDGDSNVFAEAQEELDGLSRQQEQLLERSVQRLVSSLEGSQRLDQAQQRVEQLIANTLGDRELPQPLITLLESGWRTALVQLALREGPESAAWREESELIRNLVDLLPSGAATNEPLGEARGQEMTQRLQALSRRLGEANPGSMAHEQAVEALLQTLAGEAAPSSTARYREQTRGRRAPSRQRVESLPRLRRWLKRVADLQTNTRLRYRDSGGNRRQMRLVWISEDRNRYAFVNERGQKIAELSAVQLARQLSRGAHAPDAADELSVMEQSIYDTLESAQRRLSFDRNQDQLTQLMNADGLLQQLQRSVRHAQGHGAEHAFLLLDIDRFALVNEVFDETSGDEVLLQFARFLSQLNDRRALSARMAEDEFGVLLTYRSAEEAHAIADRIRSDISAGILKIDDERVTFTASVGVSPILQSTEDADSVMDQARSALELAKAQGRDQVVVYNVEQRELLNYQRERSASQDRLAEAIALERLALRGQPIVQGSMDGSERARHHYEVLLALRTDDGELGSPVEFIASAERFGYMTQVDRWVVREVFRWMSTLMDRQKMVPELSINLSGASITDNDFLDYLLEQISEFGVGTSHLCFEITETGAVDSLPRAADFVRTLKNLGCKFSLDDFGTGLSSYAYLKELPVDYVKIDGSFVTRIRDSSTDYAMAKSINDLAHFLGQKTIAECVETLDILPTLREIGIDYLQGWGVGMPRLLEDITAELDNLET